MIWAVTGTRHGATPFQLASVGWLFSRYEIKTLHDGDAIGVDEQVYYLARAFKAQIEIHPPANDKYRAFCGFDSDVPNYRDVHHPPKPYHERDEDMVDACEALVSVQWKAEEMSRGGTRYTTEYARTLNRPIALVWPNGHISYENWTIDYAD